MKRTSSQTAPRRIAMISTHGYVAANPPLGAADTGGQVVYVLELSKKLAQLGYEVDIWTRRFGDQPEQEAVAPGVQVLRAACGGPKFIRKEDLWQAIPEWVENALGIIEHMKLKYEVLNTHYWDAGVAGRLLAQALAVPHIHTPHSLGEWKRLQMIQDFPEDQERFEKQYNFTRRIREEKRLYQESDLVIATTAQQVDVLKSRYVTVDEKVRMLPPGYDDHRFYPVGEATREVLRRRFGFQGKTVLALGRLARNKGYDLLIDGFAIAAKRHAEATLHLAVGGESMNARERAILAELKARAAATGFGDRIHFGSFVADSELADVYRAADVFVLSSRYEPFGMTAVEAMACGTATIVTTHGGLYQNLKYGSEALFSDPFDREDLGISISKVLGLPQLKAELSEKGARRARSLFTWTSIAQQMIGAIEDLHQARRVAAIRPPGDAATARTGDAA